MENMKEYTIKVLPIEEARTAAKEREEQESIKGENTFKSYVDRISQGLAVDLRQGYRHGDFECFRKEREPDQLFSNTTLCIKALNAVARAYEAEGYSVNVVIHGEYYRKVGTIYVYTN